MSIGGFCFADQQSDFALYYFPRLERLQHFGGAAAQKFFVELGYFARDHDISAGATNLGYVLQCFYDAVRSFVKRLRPPRIFDRLKSLSALTAPRRKKSVEAEGIGGQSACHECHQECRRSRYRHNWHALLNRQRDQAISWIGNSRHARVRDQRDARALLYRFYWFRRLPRLMVFVIARRPRGDRKMVEQLLRLPRIFAGDQVNFFQYAQRPQRNVFEIPDRRSDQIQRGFSVRSAHTRLTIAEGKHRRGFEGLRWLLKKSRVLHFRPSLALRLRSECQVFENIQYDVGQRVFLADTCIRFCR